MSDKFEFVGGEMYKSEFVGGISVTKVKLTITESKCRCGYFKKGQEFIVEDLCPPLCHELWNNIYPSVYALQNGASLDYGLIMEKDVQKYLMLNVQMRVEFAFMERL